MSALRLAISLLEMRWARSCLGLSLLLLTFACSDSRHEKAFHDLAQNLNPVLKELRPVALAISSARADDYDGIVQRCSNADEALQVLRDIDGTIPGQPAIKQIAVDLLDNREHACRRNSPDWYKWCGDFCRDRWLSLVKEVEWLRAQARKVGVDLVSLSP